jgi:tRNA dimethylallyltransferase
MQGQLTFEEMRQRLLTRIRRFARAQDVWFRKMEREDMAIHWLPGGDADKARALAGAFLRGEPVPAPEFRLQDRVYGPRRAPRRATDTRLAPPRP